MSCDHGSFAAAATCSERKEVASSLIDNIDAGNEVLFQHRLVTLIAAEH